MGEPLDDALMGTRAGMEKWNPILPHLRSPHANTVSLRDPKYSTQTRSGEQGKVVTNHFHQSEQVPEHMATHQDGQRVESGKESSSSILLQSKWENLKNRTNKPTSFVPEWVAIHHLGRAKNQEVCSSSCVSPQSKQENGEQKGRVGDKFEALETVSQGLRLGVGGVGRRCLTDSTRKICLSLKHSQICLRFFRMFLNVDRLPL